jgi:hypothetical protein
MKLLPLLALGLLAIAAGARADMYPDASNAKLPDARTNLKIAPHVAGLHKEMMEQLHAPPAIYWK